MSLNNVKYKFVSTIAMQPKDETITPPEITKKTVKKRKRSPLKIPQYHVVLLDDNDHTYDYVIEMLMQLFGHSSSTAFFMAWTVDHYGRVIVDTTTKERAELKRDQIRNYGADWRLSRSKGSMRAVIEPVEGAGD